MIRNIDLKPEDQLLLSCAQTRMSSENENKIKNLLDSNLNWKFIFDKARINGLVPLLYYNLNRIDSNKIPDNILLNLKKLYHKNVHRNILLTAELIKVFDLLKNGGVKAVTYKGPVLALNAYGSLAFREFGDVDILIRKADVNKAKKIMNDNGFYLDPPIELKTSIYIQLASEYQFKNSFGGIIEINWSFIGNYFYFPNSPKLLFNDLKNYKINDFVIKTISPENDFLMLCIHCSKHNWKRILWICDLREFLENNEINWADLWEKADQLAVKRIVIINLILLKNLFGLEYQKIAQLSDKYAQELACQIIRRKFIEDKNSWSKSEKIFLYLKKRENFTYGLMDLLGNLTKPIYQDYQNIKLPESFFGLYLVIRPFLLLKKHLRNQF